MPILAKQKDESTAPTLVRKLVSSLKVSPEQLRTYGEFNPKDPDNAALIESIRKHGVRVPIVITQDRYIASGNRRYNACLAIGQKKVLCQVLDYKRKDNLCRFLLDLADYNQNREKNNRQRFKEQLIAADPHEPIYWSYHREPSHADSLVDIEGSKRRHQISAEKRPMADAIIRILENHKTRWPVSVRFVHYRLVEAKDVFRNTRLEIPYVNDQNSYNDLSDMLTRLRLFGEVPWTAIDDETRTNTTWNVHNTIGSFVRKQLGGFLKGYWRNLMQSQPDYIHVIVEKNTAKKFVEEVTGEYCIPTTTGRGFASIDAYYDIHQLYQQSGKDRFKLIVVSDLDPQGEEIVQVAGRTLRDDFGVRDLELHKAGVTHEQVAKYGILPNFDVKESSLEDKYVKKHGKSVHELEALTVEDLQTELRHVIDSVIDTDAYNDEVNAERDDKAQLDTIRQITHDSLMDLDDLDLE